MQTNKVDSRQSILTAHRIPRPAKKMKQLGQPPNSWASSGVAIRPNTVPELEAA